jgi:hypothetical protein
VFTSIIYRGKKGQKDGKMQFNFFPKSGANKKKTEKADSEKTKEAKKTESTKNEVKNTQSEMEKLTEQLIAKGWAAKGTPKTPCTAMGFQPTVNSKDNCVNIIDIRGLEAILKNDSLKQVSKKLFSLKKGVDVIWASHPHVMQPWELKEDGTKLIMYSMGNLISGQRNVLNFDNPTAPREYTGDAYMIQIKAKKHKGAIKFFNLNPILLTNYMDSDKNMVIKRFTEEFIESYIGSGSPMDKAGAYGIQSGGGKFVEKYDGDFDTVVGLSVSLTEKLIREAQNDKN